MQTQLPEQALLKESVVKAALLFAQRSGPFTDEELDFLREAIVEAQAAEQTALAIQAGVSPHRVWFPDRP